MLKVTSLFQSSFCDFLSLQIIIFSFLVRKKIKKIVKLKILKKNAFIEISFTSTFFVFHKHLIISNIHKK